jgi:hypothetical protein
MQPVRAALAGHAVGPVLAERDIVASPRRDLVGAVAGEHAVVTAERDHAVVAGAGANHVGAVRPAQVVAPFRAVHA